MATIIKIDTRSNAAKRFLAYVKTLSFVKVEEETQSPYDPEFVKMVKKSAASKKKHELKDVEEFWESL